MLPAILWLFLSLLSLSNGAALFPVRQANATTPAESSCPAAVTVTATVTVTIPPAYVTVGVPDPSSISSSLASASSVDSVQNSITSEEGPTHSLTYSVPPPVFTHPLVIPAYTASETADGTSVWFISVGPSTTDWHYTPTQTLSITYGTTYVTVLPVPSSSQHYNTTGGNGTAHVTLTEHLTRTTTRTLHTAFTPDPHGWNHTSGYYPPGPTFGTAGTAGTAGTGRPWGTRPTFSHRSTVTFNATSATTTYSIPSYSSLSLPPISQPPSLPSYGFPLEKRQTCTEISATFSNGHVESWCANWDGSTVVQHTSYETTIYAGSTTSSTSQPASPTTPSSSTEQTSASSSTTPPALTSSTASASSSATPSTLSSSTTSAAPSSTSCDVDGNYVIDFDDLPVYAAPDNTTHIPPPLDQYNPCDNIYWGSGWSYVPLPNEPYLAQSGNHLAVYDPDQANYNGSSSIVPVDCAFGAGPHRSDSAYWFNARSAYIGCNDTSHPCDFVATGYQWNVEDDIENVAVTQHYPQPPCPHQSNCTLNQIFFGTEFVALSSLAFYANVQGVLTPFFVDTIAITWWDDTCAGGQTRNSTAGCPGKENGPSN